MRGVFGTIAAAGKKNPLSYWLFYRLKRYCINPLKAAALRDTAFPPEVWIENTDCCNARCTICPRDSLTRPLGFMSYALFEKLIREVARHREQVRRVHLHNFGEPLLDPDLARKISLAKSLGIAHTYFVTNAALLSSRTAHELIAAGLDEFKVSFYGYDRPSYASVMRGLDFDRSLANLREFVRLRRASGRKRPVMVVQYIPTSADPAAAARFTELMNSVIDRSAGDSLFITPLHNYGTGKSFIPAGKIAQTCPFPWKTMVILYDGTVVPCCLDYNGVQVMGNADEMTIERLWHSEPFVRARRDFRRLRYGTYPVCRTCNVPQW